MTTTRYEELGFEKQGEVWRFVTTEDNAAVGPQYKTKVELLGDLYRYARLYGCKDAQ